VRDLVPCAEKVRFAKTGGEANLACLRLARAHTGRDVVLSTAYHGWQDYLTDAGMVGVPAVIARVAEKVPYLDIDAVRDAFDRHRGRVAAVLTVPFNFREPLEQARAYCQALRELTAENGAVLIFDEVLTGFRLGVGGAQERFGVIPDLAVFAKAIANGYSLACFCGKAELMDELDRTIVTATHNGEAVSLAAGIATMRTLRDGRVHERIRASGRRLKQGIRAIAGRLGLDLGVEGIDEAPVMSWDRLPGGYEVFEREMTLGGVFLHFPMFLMDAHRPEDIDQALAVCERALAAVKKALDA